MFVDDFLFAHARDTIKHSMAASMEVLYIILGFLDTKLGQNVLSLDTYFESVFSHERVQLNILLNTRSMTLPHG